MRTTAEILTQYDNPDTIPIPDSTVSSVRGRLPLETLLDIRNLSTGIPAILNGTTPIHLLGFIVVNNVTYAMGYNDSTGVIVYTNELDKVIVNM